MQVNAPGRISRLAWHDPASLPEPLTATTRTAVADAVAGRTGVIRKITRDDLREARQEAPHEAPQEALREAAVA